MSKRTSAAWQACSKNGGEPKFGEIAVNETNILSRAKIRPLAAARDLGRGGGSLFIRVAPTNSSKSPASEDQASFAAARTTTDPVILFLPDFSSQVQSRYRIAKG